MEVLRRYDAEEYMDHETAELQTAYSRHVEGFRPGNHSIDYIAALRLHILDDIVIPILKIAGSHFLHSPRPS